MDVENFYKEREAFLNARQTYKEFLKGMTEEKLANLFAAVFAEFPELDRFIVQGYTPGFNDGDPCTHSMLDPTIIACTVEQWNEAEQARYELDKGRETRWLQEPCIFENMEDLIDDASRDESLTAGEYKHYGSYSGNLAHLGLGEKVGKLNDLIWSFSDLFEELYQTDFEITVYRDGDKVALTNEYYDCGH